MDITKEIDDNFDKIIHQNKSEFEGLEKDLIYKILDLLDDNKDSNHKALVNLMNDLFEKEIKEKND